MNFVYVSKINLFNLQFPAVLLREHGAALDGRRVNQEMQSLGVADSEGIHKPCGMGENQREAKIKTSLWGGQFWADDYYVATAVKRGE